MVLGFEPTTFWTWASSHNHYTRVNVVSFLQTLLWLKVDFNYDVYLEKKSFEMLRKYFVNIDGGIKVLEESLCDWREFGFVHFEQNINDLAGKGSIVLKCPLYQEVWSLFRKQISK